MESKKINQLATELTPSLSDLTIIGDPSTGISKKITLSQMASLFTGTVEEYANLAAFPLVGVVDTIYIALDTNVLYRWNTGTTSYVELSPNIINSLVFSDANGFDGTIGLVGSVATLTITTALTTGSVPFIGASGALLQDNANFFWDDTNNRLGIGTNAPTTAIDVFGSGIIGRLNGTSTNNAFLGFASAGSNKWSIGNVQSDHRFRIYNEATTSELVSVLSTGEFGIGIANPTTKLHIDGGASALIANLDANVSVAKSISFRSDNSNRINLEVSGTESGSNAGADFFLRAYSDAGSLLNTPLTIVRSTGAATFISTVTASSIIASSSSPIFRALFSPSPTYFTDYATNGITINGLNQTFSITGGNVGIGITPSSWASGWTALQVGTASLHNVGSFSQLSNNIFYDGTNYKYINTAGAVRIGMNTDGEFFIGSAPSGSAGSNATIVTRLSINGSSGAASFTNTISNRIGLTVYGAAGGYTTGDNPFIGLGTTASDTFGAINAPFGDKMRFNAYHGFEWYTSNGGASGTPVSKLILSTLGYLGINTSSPRGILNTKNGTGELVFSQTNGRDIESFANGSRGNMDLLCLQLYISNLGTGTVYSNGGVLTNTNPSDKNLKENITDLSFGLNEILQLRPVSYDWKNNPTNQSTQYGFIAQEVQEILPQLVTEFDSFEDEEREIATKRLGLDKDAIFVSLVKAIQEQQAQIEELKAK